MKGGIHLVCRVAIVIDSDAPYLVCIGNDGSVFHGNIACTTAFFQFCADKVCIQRDGFSVQINDLCSTALTEVAVFFIMHKIVTQIIDVVLCLVVFIRVERVIKRSVCIEKFVIGKYCNRQVCCSRRNSAVGSGFVCIKRGRCSRSRIFCCKRAKGKNAYESESKYK